MDARDFDFEVVHFGVNCAEGEASREAERFRGLFGIEPMKDGADSVYAGPLVELMKRGARGTHGHIAVATNDLPQARRWLEDRGCAFDESSAKYDENGRMIVLYLKDELAGFAVHLLQRERRNEN